MRYKYTHKYKDKDNNRHKYKCMYKCKHKCILLPGAIVVDVKGTLTGANYQSNDWMSGLISIVVSNSEM